MKVELGAILTALLVFVFVVWLAYVDAKDWEEFRTTHECKVVAHVSGSTFNTLGFDSKGNAVVGVGSTPDKTGWLCNDGVTYYR